MSDDRAAALALTPVSRETLARLDRFVDLLRTWQKTTNLVAPSTMPQLWTRHVADSLQLLELAPTARQWLDLGSGGGFPGVVIACALAERGGYVRLIESNAKKAAFLREAVRVTEAPAEIIPQRIETFIDAFQGSVDVVTARALAPLPKLLEYVQPFVAHGAQALLLKGQDVATELTESARYWKIEAELKVSKTSAEARILVVHSLAEIAALQQDTETKRL